MQSAVDMFVKGGPIVWLLLALSILSLTVILLRAQAFRHSLSGQALRQAALTLWDGGERASAMETLGTAGKSPADRLLLHAMRAQMSGRPRPSLDPDLEWRGNAELARLSRHLRLLELIAMVSPLLGLLGTVVGMIEAFQSLAQAEGAANAALLAGGIWVALLTTAAGLLVAIPAAVAATLFTARVEEVALSIESALGRFLASPDDEPTRFA